VSTLARVSRAYAGTLRARPPRAAYASGLAMAMGPHHINVNCIAPGLVTVDRDVTQVSQE
jgi:NAD(P)-dependent dehydrogenase (short-subunit alcohol dehydrogenase family)